jgi:hypothetical protein
VASTHATVARGQAHPLGSLWPNPTIRHLHGRWAGDESSWGVVPRHPRRHWPQAANTGRQHTPADATRAAQYSEDECGITAPDAAASAATVLGCAPLPCCHETSALMLLPRSYTDTHIMHTHAGRRSHGPGSSTHTRTLELRLRTQRSSDAPEANHPTHWASLVGTRRSASNRP